jgi:hypothetical protein
VWFERLGYPLVKRRRRIGLISCKSSRDLVRVKAQVRPAPVPQQAAVAVQRPEQIPFPGPEFTAEIVGNVFPMTAAAAQYVDVADRAG